jgi:hypothetical protein
MSVSNVGVGVDVGVSRTNTELHMFSMYGVLDFE